MAHGIYRATISVYTTGDNWIDGKEWAMEQLKDMAREVDETNFVQVISPALYKEICQIAISLEVIDLPYPANRIVVSAKLILAHKREIVSEALLEDVWGMVERITESVKDGMELDDLL